MDSDKKKRKTLEEEEEEENEEEKIERFFGLVKSSREIRELLMMRKQDLKVINDQARRVDPVVAPVWRPTFRPEDFGVAPAAGQEAAGPSSGDGDVKRENNKGLDLDLNLSL